MTAKTAAKKKAKKKAAKIGRPSSYTVAITNKICDRLALGESLVKICEDKAMPSLSTVFNWLADHSGFLDKYARAREAQSDFHVDEMISIADEVKADSEAVAKARLRIDTRKWTASKQSPAKYGDTLKIDANVTPHEQALKELDE